MSKNITIIDSQYKDWIADLSNRYRQSQVKAAVKLNTEMLRFYWSLGRDVVALKAEARWGDKFMKNLSADHATTLNTAVVQNPINTQVQTQAPDPTTNVIPNLSL